MNSKSILKQKPAQEFTPAVKEPFVERGYLVFDTSTLDKKTSIEAGLKPIQDVLRESYNASCFNYVSEAQGKRGALYFSSQHGKRVNTKDIAEKVRIGVLFHIKQKNLNILQGGILIN